MPKIKSLPSEIYLANNLYSTLEHIIGKYDDEYVYQKIFLIDSQTISNDDTKFYLNTSTLPVKLFMSVNIIVSLTDSNNDTHEGDIRDIVDHDAYIMRKFNGNVQFGIRTPMYTDYNFRTLNYAKITLEYTKT